MRRNVNALVTCCAALAFASAAPSSPAADLAERVLDLSPERVAAFKKTLAEFGARRTLDHASAEGLDLAFQDVYDAPFILDDGSTPDNPRWEEGLPLGVTGRDLVAEEQFLIEGREDDVQDAARKWLSRRVKGSDAARSSRGSRLAPKFAWDDGPVVGVRKGPVSATVSEDGWQLRWSRSLPQRPGWVARVSAGVEDGEERVAFSIGRSLLRAAER
jgi:hypothetical protein